MEQLTTDIIDISFELPEAKCQQHIRLLDQSYDKDSLVAGLNSGALETKLDYGLDITCVIVEKETSREIAYISGQVILTKPCNFQ